MARIEQHTHIEAPPQRVWSVLTDWEGQERWMADARSVEVRSPHRQGVDVLISCRTAIVPGLVVTDDMITTEWVEGQRIAVRHLGRLIRGVGAFELDPTADGTRFTWWEEVEAPLGVLGEAVANLVAVPYTSWVFRRSLAALKRVCESRAVRP